MTTEISFSKDYRASFREALEENNTYKMQKLFEQLADEVGIPNPKRDAEHEALGKAAADIRNKLARGQGPGKKV